MANLSDVKKYTPKPLENFFFDNNIWIYLFCPIGNHNKGKQRIYSSFLSKIKSVGSTIWINSLVLSEFYNTSIRLDYNLWKKDLLLSGGKNFDYKKDYRKTKRYKDTVASINSSILNILSICCKSSDNFNALNCDEILSNIEIADFNDSYYAEYCNKSSFIIVTDDSDLLKIGKINIITDL